jgi:Fe-S-cluster containining protein
MSESLAFICRLCGHCCQGEGGIVLAEGDIARLATHLGLSREAFLDRAAQLVQGKYRIISRPDGFCLFFAAGTGCGVHPARPDICRAWPFFRGNLIDAVSWEMAQDFCPGINPDVPHTEFARQGLVYLRQHGICRASGTCPAGDAAGAPPQDAPRQADTPEALVVDATPPARSDTPKGSLPHAS